MECIKLEQRWYENKPLADISYLWQKYNFVDNVWTTIFESDNYSELLEDLNHNYKGWFKDGDRDIQRIIEKKCTYKIKTDYKEDMKRFRKHLKELGL